MSIGVMGHPDFVRDSLRRAALARFFATLPASVEARNEIAARHAALSQLSSDQLREMGLGRADVARAAVLGADA